MTREAFREFIKDHTIILDGATGTNLQKAGMPVGVCPEKWIEEHPQAIINLQKAFIEAGSEILYAPTFTGNRIKLAEYGLENELEEINTDLVRISKSVAGENALVAGDMTMTGEQLYPMGDLTFEELVDVYKEQAQVLEKAGVDLYVVETMMSLQESRAAVIAIREVSDLPIMVSMTFEADGTTLYGTTPEIVPVVLGNLGADVVGVNCSTGPEKMAEVVAKMYEYSSVPILAKPNNGLPEIDENGNTVYTTTPEEFAEAGRKLIEAGAQIVGGCCGTTPDHIRALKDAVKDMPRKPVDPTRRRVLTSERSFVALSPDGNFHVVGERINPTGKKKLQAELRAGKLDLVRTFAKSQEKNGASILDVNMGTNGIDEKEMMLRAITEITQVSSLPLCIDSSFPEVIEAALRVYPGRALINSISFEKKKFEQLIPVAKKYGAMFILLPLDDRGIPKTIEDKHAILDEALGEAFAAGFTPEDIVVDSLVATVGADPNSARSCFATFDYCHEKGLLTICGLSNISFGLPNRIYVNAAFLGAAISHGLNLAIANPSQDLLMNTAFAADMLMAKPTSDLRYINRMKYFEEQEAKRAEEIAKLAQSAPAPDATAPGSTLKKEEKTGKNDFFAENSVARAVLEGDKDNIVAYSKEEMERGLTADDVINKDLIPAINEVGRRFDTKEFFLPQLIAGANAMEKAIAYLEPLIKKDPSVGEKETIVIATVEGDVHDIGKNLVALMLRNYGYKVIDLGKNVPAKTIVDTAIEKGAAVIGLSALMTTTMMHMKDVIALAHKKSYPGRIIIGGAAVTESYASEIGADGYSADAASCVQLVQRLLA
ncbi:MAG: homocysteine S-methyltransferase family protein [Lachnospiraceae bacterium]|nr:homocysteine S-methyltransferase family protein [Lachnospiraceae bacterium]